MMRQIIQWLAVGAGAMIGLSMGVLLAWLLVAFGLATDFTGEDTRYLFYGVIGVFGAIFGGGLMWFVLTKVEGVQNALDTDKITFYFGRWDVFSEEEPSTISSDDVEKMQTKNKSRRSR